MGVEGEIPAQTKPEPNAIGGVAVGWLGWGKSSSADPAAPSPLFFPSSPSSVLACFPLLPSPPLHPTLPLRHSPALTNRFSHGHNVRHHPLRLEAPEGAAAASEAALDLRAKGLGV